MPFTAKGEHLHQTKEAFNQMILNTEDESGYPLITATRKNVRVEISWECPEGKMGDYDPTNPDDEPLLRFDVLRKEKGSNWKACDDASYCTNLRAYEYRGLLQQAAEIILNEVFERASAGESIKKICERLSHISIKKNKVVI
jgi:hypothetical protein